MESDYTVKQQFEHMDFRTVPLKNGAFESCIFQHCDFSNSGLGDLQFIDCDFLNCNLSMANQNNTALRDTRFKGCKLLGWQFERCHPFGFSVYFENCILNHSSFTQMKMSKTIFRNVKLLGADFTGADLQEAIFDQCDLAGAVFENTNLSKADFRTSFHYSIHPESNRIKKARFTLNGITGLLDKYDIIIE